MEKNPAQWDDPCDDWSGYEIPKKKETPKLC